MRRKFAKALFPLWVLHGFIQFRKHSQVSEQGALPRQRWMGKESTGAASDTWRYILLKGFEFSRGLFEVKENPILFVLWGFLLNIRGRRKYHLISWKWVLWDSVWDLTDNKSYCIKIQWPVFIVSVVIWEPCSEWVGCKSFVFLTSQTQECRAHFLSCCWVTIRIGATVKGI